MKTIYKYPLRTINEIATVELPVGAKILSLGLDPLDNICIWAAVDTKVSLTYTAFFWVYGTGQPTGAIGELNFLGTVKQGQYMWHVFTNYEIN